MGLPLYIQNLCSLILLNFTNKKKPPAYSRHQTLSLWFVQAGQVSAKVAIPFAVSDFIWVAGFGKDSCCDPNV
ncbi:hypothetical protein [Neisseria gonorrhoeae]|uniref:hypothetical protein n=1 Tax=Neisseria gonorrhoeae TaxID=485 RepID=UPI0021A6CB5E|nr:hypothetical protein [Neisseria gonorrhoeae]UWT37053.1 hypothetical protein NDQ65_08250 [Neisseria gonorrhoeae]